MYVLYIIRLKYMIVSMSIRLTILYTSSSTNSRLSKSKYLLISIMLSSSRVLLGFWKNRNIVYALLKYFSSFINTLIYFQIVSLNNLLSTSCKNSFSNSFCIGVTMLDFSFTTYLFIEFITYIEKKKLN